MSGHPRRRRGRGARGHVLGGRRVRLGGDDDGRGVRGEAEEDCGGVGASSPRPPTRRPPRCASASPADPLPRRAARRASGERRGDGDGRAAPRVPLIWGEK